jgi:hypothetical protein
VFDVGEIAEIVVDYFVVNSCQFRQTNSDKLPSKLHSKSTQNSTSSPNIRAVLQLFPPLLLHAFSINMNISHIILLHMNIDALCAQRSTEYLFHVS